MGRYTGPKTRINRALGALIYEDAGTAKAFERRSDTKPGMHPRRRRVSTYGEALQEKQKIKHYYGLRERQLRRLYDVARREPGDTGVHLLILCERRLDNVVRRAGFTRTRPQARQAVVHGHFQVNGRKVDRPAYLVAPGDVITVRPRPNIQAIYRESFAPPPQPIPWLHVEPAEQRATVSGLPTQDDVSLPVAVEKVVEVMS